MTCEQAYFYVYDFSKYSLNIISQDVDKRLSCQ